MFKQSQQYGYYVFNTDYEVHFNVYIIYFSRLLIYVKYKIYSNYCDVPLISSSKKMFR